MPYLNYQVAHAIDIKLDALLTLCLDAIGYKDVNMRKPCIEEYYLMIKTLIDAGADPNATYKDPTLLFVMVMLFSFAK